MAFFEDLIESSKQFDRESYVRNFGGIVDDVISMFNSTAANDALSKARKHIEDKATEVLPNGQSRLINLDFGNFEVSTELAEGLVAAIDGTFVLPMQKFTVGQALCVGIGSVSYKRPFEDSIHGYTTRAISDNGGQLINDAEQGILGINPSAYLRYFESLHGLHIKEQILFLDGTLVLEWLANQSVGRNVYKKLCTDKKAIGIIKNLKDNIIFSYLGTSLKSGECFIFETVYDHLSKINRQRGDVQWSKDTGFVNLTKNIFRGVFKPNKKFFGFECHIDCLEEMLRIMASDCQMNRRGHEIPYLLNLIDKNVKAFFKPNTVTARIAHQMSVKSEDLFFEEQDERVFR